jgi:hypothetical protein
MSNLKSRKSALPAIYDYPSDGKLHRAWQCYSYTVRFEDGLEIRLSQAENPKKPRNLGKAMRNAIAFYRSKIRNRFCPIFYVSLGHDNFVTMFDAHVAVPEVVGVECRTTEETFDASACSAYCALDRLGTYDYRKLEAIARDRNVGDEGNIKLWLRAAWHVAVRKHLGMPEPVSRPVEAVQAKAAPAPHPEAIEPAPQPKKRGRPFGSKNKPSAEPQDAEAYIARIRNPAKRDYARRYAEHIRNGGDAPGDYTCSYMAAQAVRTELYKLVKPAELPKPSKPRVPSHYLSSASSAAYHAAM